MQQHTAALRSVAAALQAAQGSRVELVQFKKTETLQPEGGKQVAYGFLGATAN